MKITQLGQQQTENWAAQTALTLIGWHEVEHFCDSLRLIRTVCMIWLAFLQIDQRALRKSRPSFLVFDWTTYGPMYLSSWNRSFGLKSNERKPKQKNHKVSQYIALGIACASIDLACIVCASKNKNRVYDQDIYKAYTKSSAILHTEALIQDKHSICNMLIMCAHSAQAMLI